MGVCGSAVSAVTTVRLATQYGMTTPFLVAAAVLAAFTMVALLILRDPPARAMPDRSVMSRMGAALRLPIPRQATGTAGDDRHGDRRRVGDRRPRGVRGTIDHGPGVQPHRLVRSRVAAS